MRGERPASTVEAMTGIRDIQRLCGLGAVALAMVASSPSAHAAPGTLEASVVDCTTVDGVLVATVGVSVTGAVAGTPVWLRVFYPLVVLPPPKVNVGTTDATGSLTHRFTGGGADSFPMGVRAYVNDSDKDPESEIGDGVLVEFVCPVLRPQDAVDAAVASGALSIREATPLEVKLGAAAAQEERGNSAGAISLLRAARQQIEALVASRRLSDAEARPLLEAVDREIARLTPPP